MKPVHVLFDEPLLRRLVADAEVRKFGRSAVLRRAAAAHLKRSRASRIRDAYRKAYGDGGGLDGGFAGWEDEGAWPAKWAGKASSTSPR